MNHNSEAPLADRLEAVRSAVADAARQSGRSAEDITTVVITKFHPASLVRELAGLGVREVGENRHQDAVQKAEALRDLDLVWHFVGQLQSNKARAVLEYASVVQSVDRDSIVDALAAVGSPVRIFLQLNLTGDTGRGGVAPSGLLGLVDKVLTIPSITLLGLMAVAPLNEDPRLAFERVRMASDSLRTLAPNAAALSMGMSGDFREAILEGATHLRIGTAITGKRPTPG